MTIAVPSTLQRLPLTTQSQYLSGNLTEGRQAVLKDLRRHRQVPYEQLVRSRFRILPEVSKVAEICRELKANGLITQGDKQWSAFVDKPSVHARMVFNDVGAPLMNVPILQESLSCLRDAQQGLKYMHLAGLVHRDVSVTNVLQVEDKANPGRLIGKLMDFGYAKRVEDEVSHEVRTGTMHFVAVEVENQGYLFLPDPRINRDSDIMTIDLSASAPPPFRLNPLHDLESVWWIVMWILFYHTDKASPTGQARGQLKYYKQAFPGKTGTMSRPNFFVLHHVLAPAYDTLSATYSEKCQIFQKLAIVLGIYYRQVEAQSCSFSVSDDDLKAVHDQVSIYFEEALKDLEGSPIQLEPLS